MAAVQEAIFRDPALMELAAGEPDPRVLADIFRARGVPDMPAGLQPNLQSAMFQDIPNMGALISAAAAIATPVFTGIGKGITEKATSFVQSLFGNAGDQAQETAIKELSDLQITGTTDNQGLAEVLSVANPGALRDFTRAILEQRNPQLLQSLAQAPIPGGTLFGQDVRDIQTLAPGMDMATARIAAITDLPDPMPRVAELSGFGSSFNSAETGDFSEFRKDLSQINKFNVFTGQRFVPSGFGGMDTDSGSTIPDVSAKTSIFSQASKTNEEKRREEMINIINSANTFNENQEIELMEDAFMAELQEKRIQVNQRPVPSYAMAETRFGGLQRPIKYSPFVQQ